MLLKFKCPNCNLLFEDKGIKRDYISSIYGPCFKYTAICPTCKIECDEYRSNASKKTNTISSERHSCDDCCYNCG